MIKTMNHQKLPINGFKWIKQKKKKSKFNEDFINKYDEDSNTGYFLEVDLEYLETFFNSLRFNSRFTTST